jgi:hypothetical protein
VDPTSALPTCTEQDCLPDGPVAPFALDHLVRFFHRSKANEVLVLFMTGLRYYILTRHV